MIVAAAHIPMPHAVGHLRTGPEDMMGRDGRDSGIVFEVAAIEGKNSGNGMNTHGRDRPGVVRVLACHAEAEDEPLPVRQDRGRVVVDGEHLLEFGKLSFSLGTGRPRPLSPPARLPTTQNS